MSLSRKQATIQVILSVITSLILGGLAFVLEFTGMVIAVGEPIITSHIVIGFLLMFIGLSMMPSASYLHNDKLIEMGMDRKTRIKYIIVLNLFALMVNLWLFIKIMI